MRLSAFVCTCVTLFTVTTARAQRRHGFHPSVGDVPPASIPNILSRSTMFNVPDQMWNYGEGFVRVLPPGVTAPNAPADTGGLHFFDDGTQVVPGDIKITSPTTLSPPSPPAPLGWLLEPANDLNQPDIFGRVASNLKLHRLVGYLWPHEFNATDPGNAFDAETAFEIFAPEVFDPELPTVFVIAVHPTLSGGDHLWDYSGNEVPGDFQSGLRLNYSEFLLVHFGSRGLTPVDRYAGESGTNSGANIVAGYIMPPTNQGHLLLTAQRVLQLERVMHILFSPQAPVSPPGGVVLEDTYPVVLTGGSNGGQVVTQLAAMYPDRFHAAYSTKFPMSMRRHLGEEAIWTYISATQGFENSGEGFGLQYILPYTSFYAVHNTDWAGGCVYHMWKNGLLKRPVYMLGSDEDYTWTGEDLTHVMGTPSLGAMQGVGMPIAGSKPFYWSVTDKECHDTSAEFTLPAPLQGVTAFGPSSSDQAMGVIAMIPSAIQEHQTNPISAANRPVPPPPVAGTAPGQFEGAPTPILDPFHETLYRKSTTERRAAVATGSLLVEDTAFWEKQNGLGTWLGQGTALAVDDQSRIYVGGADGVVTRLVKDAQTDELVVDSPDGRCRFQATGTSATTGPFSLGYGVSALAIGEELLGVATFGRLYVYSTSDLSQPISMVELPWLEQRPDQLQFVEGFFGGATECIAYHTWLGEFVVRDANNLSTKIASFSEPGMSRFVIEGSASTGPNEEPVSRPIWFSSARGHVLQAVIVQGQSGQPDQVEIRQASGHFGSPGPLIKSSNENGDRMVYYSEVAGTHQGSGLYFFETTTNPALDVETFIQAPGVGTTQHRVNGEMIVAGIRGGISLVSLTGGEQNEHVLLRGGHLYYFPSSGAVEKYDTAPQGASAVRIPSIHYPLAIAAADLDNEPGKDLVIATQNGQVTWIPASHLRDTSGAQLEAFSTDVLGSEWFGSGSPADPGKNSTTSIAATWGLTLGTDGEHGAEERVQVIDQSARRWSLSKATGTPEYLKTAQMETWWHDRSAETIPVYPAPKPFRGLKRFGAVSPIDMMGAQPTGNDAVVDVGLVPAGVPSTGVANESLVFHNYFDCAVQGIGFARVSPSFTLHIPFPGAIWLTYREFLHSQIFVDGYLPFAFAGDVLLPGAGGTTRAFYWGGNPPTIAGQQPELGQLVNKVGSTGIDVLRGMTFGGSPPVLATWGTATSPAGGGGRTRSQAHLRTADANESLNSQSVRVARWGPGEVTRVVCGTAGGSLQLFDGHADPNIIGAKDVLLDESDDHGFGGSALAVSTVSISGLQVIAFATHFTHAGAASTGFVESREMVSSIHFFVLGDAGGGTANQLIETSSQILHAGEAGAGRSLFGVCGLAMADLVVDSIPDGIDHELILTTLDGDLLVYDLDPSGAGVQLGGIIYHGVFDGALGATNSIAVDSSGASPVVFVAGSMGTRKFNVSTSP